MIFNLSVFVLSLLTIEELHNLKTLASDIFEQGLKFRVIYHVFCCGIWVTRE